MLATKCYKSFGLDLFMKNALFKMIFLQWKAYLRVHIVQKNRGGIWLGRPIAQAMPDWDIVLFPWYTTWARLGLLVFHAFFTAQNAPYDGAYGQHLWMPKMFCFLLTVIEKTTMHQNVFFGCTMFVFLVQNAPKSVPFLVHPVSFRWPLVDIFYLVIYMRS